MSGLDRLAPFEFQIAVWGYDTAGRVAELTAMIAEQPGWNETPNGYPLWDRRLGWLESIRVSNGEGHHGPPPAWWALPHVVGRA
jgi:hypothetical protein